MSSGIGVVIVSRGRRDLLTGTLACLLAQTWEHLSIFLVLHESEQHENYALMQYLHAFAAKGITLHVEYGRMDRSLAALRSEKLRMLGRAGIKYALMLDNDLWFDSTTIERLYMAADFRGSVATTMPMFDVRNEREYPDWSMRIYKSPDEFTSENPGSVAWAYHLYEEGGYIPVSTTNALWDIAQLRDYGVLDYWDKYPIGQRFYDSLGSKLAVEKGGYIYLHSARRPNQTFLHLWTKKTDEGYFNDTTVPGISRNF
jgi:hypothetical protein